MNKFEIISLETAKRLVTEEGYIVVDLRGREDFDNGHVENALNMEDGTLAQIEKFNRKDITWILYCKRGGASFRLANEMAENGYKVMAVVGGYKD